MAHDRSVAGIRCTEVLARLSDYIDDDLSHEARAQIDAHLAGCDWCERFGGQFAGVVADLRSSLRQPPAISEARKGRLRARLGLSKA